MNSERINYLLLQFSDDRLTDEEAEELLLHIRDENSDALNQRIVDALDGKGSSIDPHSAHWQHMLDTVLSVDKTDASIQAPKPFIRFTAFQWLSAACILFFISFAVWLTKQNTSPVISKQSKELKSSDIIPGGNKAYLTLTDGKKIILEDRRNGTLASEGNSVITKVEEGQLKVDGAGNAGVAGNEKLMVQTPNGGQYQVSLPDGTKVWLNAASSIRFPASFNSNERVVEITGEAYLEVATVFKPGNKLSQRLPFVVKTGRQRIEVLATHFNVNAYPDESKIKTTLLEGSVKVSLSEDPDQFLLLKPGQQSQTALIPNNNKSGSLLAVDADTEEAVAWKNNLFRFKNADIRSIMRQISRWYNVDIQYPDNKQNGHFTGYISRNVPVSKVLKMLEETGDLRFQVTGRTIVVSQASLIESPIN